MKELGILLKNLISKKIVSEYSKLLFVDDGSRDATWQIIYKESLQNEYVRGLKLSRNVGHQNALLAGMDAARKVADCVISIDADLQDDIAVIPDFLDKYSDGNEIVFGVRNKRVTDTVFKRTTAQGFYKLMNKMGVELVYNHADFRLMSRRAVDELLRFGETNLFLRGIVTLIGFKTASVFYDRKERAAGETKYPLKKMLAFAADAITSFSITPIRLVLLLGFISFFVSLIFGGYFLTLKFFGSTEAGWTSLITSIWLIGGLQLIAIGLIGEYIGKVYKESKRRPKYIIDVDLFDPLKINGKERNPYESYSMPVNKLPETN
ncbi:glycosyltransferase family 2 protein [Peribacillus sp. SCS-155]|uniref:glycosyltransferase family 2 protein n=1 Tax=Peribacillus sedimenti TaxID=3115297 RepID=UPI003905CE00